MKLKPSDIPADFEVRPLRKGQEAKDRVTCGTCGLSWDDAKSTSMTPAPAGRCPFEYFHKADPRITMVCENCGSENVKADAYAEWDRDNQMWTLSGDPFDKGSYCEDCDGECSIIEKVIP